ncbi:Os05g0525701 [Oryza sativa Japonica Group]|uniref:Os05g0525701 protein n=1 Tax=Oryza sativa subsp. japonica TaxID=39947 RepID=A0A0P0WPN1_ORYSJ|nr:hypothetical protein EE612_030731 [Oryza sativa]BAS94984.1 Os05g0525701 [Oryza sativa Japonica Group]
MFTSTTPSMLPRARRCRVHWMIVVGSGSFIMGGCPVITSSNTTPKLYTSIFSETCRAISILGCKVAICANHPDCGYMCVTVAFKSRCQAKIGNLGLKICIQQDVR